MSASTEVLLEQILKTKVAIRDAEASGDVTTIAELQTYLRDLNIKLEEHNAALTEGKQVLKG